jgi:hypothetical protein
MNHSHEHDHEHGHHHSHGPDHDHDHAQEMSLKEKLEILLSHWVDHNDSHKENFYSWAKKAEKAGLQKIAAHLEQAGALSENVTEQLKQARENLDG